MGRSDEDTSCNCGCFGCFISVVAILGFIALWSYRQEVWWFVTGGLK